MFSIPGRVVVPRLQQLRLVEEHWPVKMSRKWWTWVLFWTSAAVEICDSKVTETTVVAADTGSNFTHYRTCTYRQKQEHAGVPLEF